MWFLRRGAFPPGSGVRAERREPTTCARVSERARENEANLTSGASLDSAFRPPNGAELDKIRGSSNGRTPVSGAGYLGSNPSPEPPKRGPIV